MPQEVRLGLSKQDLGEALDGLSKESVEEEEDWGKESTGKCTRSLIFEIQDGRGDFIIGRVRKNSGGKRQA